MGSRAVYRHNYGNAAEALVWRTVHDSLGPLLTGIRRELDGRDARCVPNFSGTEGYKILLVANIFLSFFTSIILLRMDNV